MSRVHEQRAVATALAAIVFLAGVRVEGHLEQIWPAIRKAEQTTRCEVAAAGHNQAAATGKNNCREPGHAVALQAPAIQ